MQKEVRYCTGKEVFKSMDELGACTEVLHSSLICERILLTLFMQRALKCIIYLKWGLSTLILL